MVVVVVVVVLPDRGLFPPTPKTSHSSIVIPVIFFLYFFLSSSFCLPVFRRSRVATGPDTMRGRHSEAVLRRGGSSMWVAAATLAFVVLSTFPHSASSARKPSEWARMTDEEWEAVAAQWEEDDDPEERKPEGQYEYERMMRAKEEGIPQGVSQHAVHARASFLGSCRCW